MRQRFNQPGDKPAVVTYVRSVEGFKQHSNGQQVRSRAVTATASQSEGDGATSDPPVGEASLQYQPIDLLAYHDSVA